MAVSHCLLLGHESMRTQDSYAKIDALNGRCVSYKNGAKNAQIDVMGLSFDALPEAAKQGYIDLRDQIVTTCGEVINYMRHVIEQGMQAQIECNKLERNFVDCVTTGEERIHSQQKLHEHVTVMHKSNVTFEKSLVVMAGKINTTCRQILNDIASVQMKASISSPTDMDRNLCVTKLNQLRKDTKLLQKCMKAMKQKELYQPEASLTSEQLEEIVYFWNIAIIGVLFWSFARSLTTQQESEIGQ